MTHQIDHATDETFAKLTQGELVVADFYADWCGPCRMLSPIIESLAAQMSKVHFIKVDTDTCEKTAAQFQISSIPTLIIFKKGSEIDRIVGLIDEEGLKGRLTS